MMMRAAGLLAASLVLVAVFWYARSGRSPDDSATQPPFAIDHQGEVGTEVSVVPTRAIRKPAPLFDGPPLHDPIVIGPCHLTPSDEQDVASQIEGLLRHVGVELGAPVAPGDVLAELDDRLAKPQVELLQIRAKSEAGKLIAQAQLDEIENKIELAARLLAKKAIAREDYTTFLYQRQRLREEVRKAQEDQAVAHKELAKAQRALQLHQVRAGMSGEVVRVYKRPGEAVRQMEPLFSIANLDRLRVEGLCKLDQAHLLRLGMHAVVEPERRGEQITELSGHTGSITGLALSDDGRVLASASEDHTVRLWSWPSGTFRRALAHPAEVNSVAFIPGQSARLLTGCSDGILRLWDLDGDAEPAVLSGHQGGIEAISVRADGKLCATAGEDRRIGIWDLGARKRLYWAHGSDSEFAHQGAVTTVHFAPQDHLISAGRDNALRLWKLSEDSAALVGVQPGRSGDVARLGLSPDGTKILFDHGEELRLLDPQDWSTQGTLHAGRQTRPQGFAIFSPSGRLILSGGGNGRLLWTVPTGPAEAAFLRHGYRHGFRPDALLAPVGFLPGRALATWSDAVPRLWHVDGYELRRYQASAGTGSLCAVIAPDESVAFTAGADRVVRVWALPVTPPGTLLEAVITYVGSQVERGTDMVRVRAEFNNPGTPAQRLRPGTYANLRVYPEAGPQP